MLRFEVPVWVKENAATSQPGHSESAKVAGSLGSCNTRCKRKKRRESSHEGGPCGKSANTLATYERRKRKERLSLADETDLGTAVERLDSSDLWRRYTNDNPAEEEEERAIRKLNKIALAKEL